MGSKSKSSFWKILSATICYMTALTLVTAMIVACVTTPETNRSQIMIVGDSQMNAMGVQAYEEMRSKEKIITSGPQKDVIVRVGNAIAAASGKNYQWEFTLFDEPKTVNAFCLPGGKVGVYTGILSVAENEAGLAAIMGHEVAHAILRHGGERISQTILIQSGVSLATLTFRNEKYRAALGAALGVGAQFGVLLPYSRKHESEADTVGLKYMAKAGYDPNEAVTLWQRMAKLGGGRVPEILSTHPDPMSRSKTLKDEIPSVMGFYNNSKKLPSTKIPI